PMSSTPHWREAMWMPPSTSPPAGVATWATSCWTMPTTPMAARMTTKLPARRPSGEALGGRHHVAGVELLDGRLVHVRIGVLARHKAILIRQEERLPEREQIVGVGV